MLLDGGAGDALGDDGGRDGLNGGREGPAQDSAVGQQTPKSIAVDATAVST